MSIMRSWYLWFNKINLAAARAAAAEVKRQHQGRINREEEEEKERRKSQKRALIYRHCVFVTTKKVCVLQDN